MKRHWWWMSVVAILLSSCTLVSGWQEPTSRSVTPLPAWLQFVEPEPGESYTLAQYESIVPSPFGGLSTAPGICASVAPSPLLEPGDYFPIAEDWLDRVHVVVDETVITEYYSLIKTDLRGGEGIDPETGEVIWREPDGSPLLVCYRAPLSVGQHVAEIVVERASGVRESYAWSFVITENE